MEEEVEFVVQPYQFEPVYESDYSDSSAQDSTDEETDQPAAVGQNVDHNSGYVNHPDNWCSCDRCVAMPTQLESWCCKDFVLCKDKMQETDLTSITQHEGFQVNCLNRHVLELAFYEYLDYNGPVGDEEPIHELYRYIAYRRFTRWIWHKLGKGNRKVIPSCVVAKIREHFPSEEVTGFKYHRDF